MTTSFSKLAYYYKFLFRTLWLSISSSDFYIDVHSKYRGYGVRYVLILFMISGLIFSIGAFNNIIELEKSISPANPDIEYILKQIPDMYYDGNYLTTQAEMPLFIYDQNNRKIAAIDLNRELSPVDRNKLFAVFGNNYIQLPVKMGAVNSNNMNAEYKYLFGSEPSSINNSTILSFLPKIWDNINKAFIYILVPLGGLGYFIGILIYNVPYAIFIWLVSYFWDFVSRSSASARESFQIFDFKSNRITSLQTAYRMTMFASSSTVFLRPILLIINPALTPIVAAISLASWVSMIMGIIKFKRGK